MPCPEYRYITLETDERMRHLLESTMAGGLQSYVLYLTRCNVLYPMAQIRWIEAGREVTCLECLAAG